jgi:hypothetical protein
VAENAADGTAIVAQTTGTCGLMMVGWWLLYYIPAAYWLLGSAAIIFIELFGTALLPKAAVDEVSLWGKVRDHQQYNVPKRYIMAGCVKK